MTTETQVRLNGEARSFPRGATLLRVVHALELAPERVAIELNRAIISRDRWDAVCIEDGAEIEIVQFVGGG